MASTNRSKDIEVEITFNGQPNNSGEFANPGNYTTYFIFGEVDIWKVVLWQEKPENILPVGVPTKFFVEFEFPQSLFSYLSPGRAFEV